MLNTKVLLVTSESARSLVSLFFLCLSFNLGPLASEFSKRGCYSRVQDGLNFGLLFGNVRELKSFFPLDSSDEDL